MDPLGRFVTDTFSPAGGEVGAQCAPMAARRARLLALATAVLCAWRQPGTHAYDPFQTDTSAPWNKNASKRFHPVCVCPGGAASCAACARSRCICARLMLGCGVQLQSMSFAHVLFDGFDLKYADTADLRGYIGQDIVQLGHYYARTKFGCITRCDSADFNGVDGVEKKARSLARSHARTLARSHARTHARTHAHTGTCVLCLTHACTNAAGILGVGMPDAALASIPEPLIFAITDNTGLGFRVLGGF